MRGLQLVNGDIALGPRGYAEVTGVAKIQQDLTLAVLTPYGSDRFHPTWGSTLESQIGSAQGPLTQSTISSEITRVVQNYMLVQNNTLTMAQTNGYTSPYSNDDLVSGIASLAVSSNYDVVSVACTVATASGGTTTLSTSVAPTGVTAATS